MTSFDYRLNPLYPIKECSSCGALYTTDYCCSDGSLVDKIIFDLNKTPNLPQRPPQNYPKCENPVDGQYCQGCALLRKELKEVWFTICEENGILQGFLDTSESSNDNTNVVKAPQDPFVVKQDPGKNFSQSPPHINHHFCYGCGDSLEDIFCHQCTCESCGKGAHYGYNCPPKVLIILNLKPCNNQTVDELLQTLPSFDPTCYFGDGNSFTYDSKSNIVDDSPNFPVIHQPIREKTYAELLAKERSDDDSTLIDDDSFSIDDIEYVEASPPDSELVSLEVVAIVIPEVGRIDADILSIFFLTCHLRKACKDCAKITKKQSKPDKIEHEISKNAQKSDFYEFTDELAHIISPPEYDCFSFKNEPNLGDFTMDVVEDIFPTREPRVHVPNVLPTHPTVQLNLDLILFSESLFTYVVWIFLPFLSYSVAPQYLLSFGNKDTIFDPGISICHSFIPNVSHRIGTFIKFNVYPKHLNGSPMEILFSTCSPMDQ
uniref:CCHC-type domain-containing protein n=1 Tax=Tanacetum cinerariifolium TaxID=118510 RepID=A0A6L2NYB5_TANCI|nr:hypothetical protein [Tanacetum cinerariifolium]